MENVPTWHVVLKDKTFRNGFWSWGSESVWNPLSGGWIKESSLWQICNFVKQTIWLSLPLYALTCHVCGGEIVQLLCHLLVWTADDNNWSLVRVKPGRQSSCLFYFDLLFSPSSCHFCFNASQSQWADWRHSHFSVLIILIWLPSRWQSLKLQYIVLLHIIGPLSTLYIP